MVHALEEIHRTLIPEGILLDLRPLANRWPVEVVAGSIPHRLGRLTDLPKGLADDLAANNAIAESEQSGWFVKEMEDIFSIYLYWDTPEELLAQMTERWNDFVKLEEETFELIQTAWKNESGEKRLRIKMKMLLARSRKR
jgi:hypothetical protein